jgi:hypothetical protein
MRSHGYGHYTLTALGEKAFTPLFIWDFEEEGKPDSLTILTEDYTDLYDFDFTPALKGGMSLVITGTNAVVRSLSPNSFDHSDSYAAGVFKFAAFPSVTESAFLTIDSAGASVQASARINADGSFAANIRGGSSSAATAFQATAGEPFYAMLRFVAGEGDATAQLWATNDISGGWGDPVTIADGTSTGNGARISIHTYSRTGQLFHYDNVVISDETIPAVYMSLP